MALGPEAKAQVEVMKWVHRHASKPVLDEGRDRFWCPDLDRLFAVPNGLFTHPQLAVEAKRQGLRSGVPDILWPSPRGGYHGLALELKRDKGGKTSDNQTDWLDYLTAVGWLCVVAHGADRAVEAISWYARQRSNTGPAYPVATPAFAWHPSRVVE